MSSKVNDGLAYVALGLAVVAAVMSVRHQAGDTQQKLLSLLETVGNAEPAAMVAPVGEDPGNPTFPVSP
jgi:hypothetical protein